MSYYDNKLRLNQTDIFIFELLEKYKMITIRQLTKMTNRNYDSLIRRLSKLEKYSFIQKYEWKDQEKILTLKYKGLKALNSNAKPYIFDNDIVAFGHTRHELYVIDVVIFLKEKFNLDYLSDIYIARNLQKDDESTPVELKKKDRQEVGRRNRKDFIDVAYPDIRCLIPETKKIIDIEIELNQKKKSFYYNRYKNLKNEFGRINREFMYFIPKKFKNSLTGILNESLNDFIYSIYDVDTFELYKNFDYRNKDDEIADYWKNNKPNSDDDYDTRTKYTMWKLEQKDREKNDKLPYFDYENDFIKVETEELRLKLLDEKHKKEDLKREKEERKRQEEEWKRLQKIADEELEQKKKLQAEIDAYKERYELVKKTVKEVHQRYVDLANDYLKSNSDDFISDVFEFKQKEKSKVFKKQKEIYAISICCYCSSTGIAFLDLKDIYINEDNKLFKADNILFTENIYFKSMNAAKEFSDYMMNNQGLTGKNYQYSSRNSFDVKIKTI